MSLVGTRPILPDELEQYELHHRARIAIKPGITGMWQVSGRSDITDFEEIVRLDTEYISEWNIGLDGLIDGLNSYHIEFYVENQSDQGVIVYLPNTTSINDYQVGAYYTMTQIASEKKGTISSSSICPEIVSSFSEERP